jgi:large subunit ribosomal protein L6
MSRIGKNPVVVPEKVTVTITERKIDVKGPNGQLEFTHHEGVNVKKEDSSILITPVDGSNKNRALWGLTRTLINNMVIGVTTGWKKDLEFTGVGYKAAATGSSLTLNLGYSHPINYELPQGVNAKVGKNTIELSGASKELVGFAAAKIRSFRPPEPYKGKGIRYSNEVIIRKAGKTGGKK